MCCEMADFPENSTIWYKDAHVALVHVQRLITLEAVDIFIQKWDFMKPNWFLSMKSQTSILFL